jgi:hypothetical protein
VVFIGRKPDNSELIQVKNWMIEQHQVWSDKLSSIIIPPPQLIDTTPISKWNPFDIITISTNFNNPLLSSSSTNLINSFYRHSILAQYESMILQHHYLSALHETLTLFDTIAPSLLSSISWKENGYQLSTRNFNARFHGVSSIDLCDDKVLEMGKLELN